MKRTYFLIFVLAIFTLTVYAGGPADNARGPADKVTGEFTHNGIYHRLLSAHEATDTHPQKGFFLSWRDTGTWWEMDFNDTENTCVNVFASGQARIGGLVKNANDGAPQVGRYFGILLVDGGEPGIVVDYGFTFRVTLDYWSEDARLALLSWCETGVMAGLYGQAIWPSVVTDGNLQVHTSPHNHE